MKGNILVGACLSMYCKSCLIMGLMSTKRLSLVETRYPSFSELKKRWLTQQ